MLRDIINSLTTERKLSNWTPEAINDITWTEISRRGTVGMGKSYHHTHYPSLSKPNTYWLEYYSETSGMIGKRKQSMLRSTQDEVTIVTVYNAIGNIKSRTIHVNDGNALRYEARNNDWILLNEGGDILARFQRGATAQNFPLSDADLAFLRGPEDPHVYEKVSVKGELLAEMIVPNHAITFARFKHQPLVPYIRNAPENLTKEQTEILLVMLALHIIN